MQLRLVVMSGLFFRGGGTPRGSPSSSCSPGRACGPSFVCVHVARLFSIAFACSIAQLCTRSLAQRCHLAQLCARNLAQLCTCSLAQRCSWHMALHSSVHVQHCTRMQSCTALCTQPCTALHMARSLAQLCARALTQLCTPTPSPTGHACTPPPHRAHARVGVHGLAHANARRATCPAGGRETQQRGGCPTAVPSSLRGAMSSALPPFPSRRPRGRPDRPDPLAPPLPGAGPVPPAGLCVTPRLPPVPRFPHLQQLRFPAAFPRPGEGDGEGKAVGTRVSARPAPLPPLPSGEALRLPGWKMPGRGTAAFRVRGRKAGVGSAAVPRWGPTEVRTADGCGDGGGRTAGLRCGDGGHRGLDRPLRLPGRSVPVPPRGGCSALPLLPPSSFPLPRDAADTRRAAAHPRHRARSDPRGERSAIRGAVIWGGGSRAASPRRGNVR